MSAVWWWSAVVVLAGACAPAETVMGGAPAAAPEPDTAVVFVQKYGFAARVEGIKHNNSAYYSFFGIRYAEPPVGFRRFQRPERRYLAGDIAAGKRCWPCIQPDTSNPGYVLGHEDCLCLNVFTPKMPGDEAGSPVVFFIHGGNYRSGSTANYGGRYLTMKDTILVTAQYRLGSLGYFSSGHRDASGNAGLFDLRAAMEWIQDYIEFFGGDPSRVVVMGQGSGASAASLMALAVPKSPVAGRACGVAALSGVALSPGAVRKDAGRFARELAARTACPSDSPERLLLCLKQLPAETIVKADMKNSEGLVDSAKFLEQISGKSGAGARVEGADDKRGLPPMVVESPTDALDKKANRIPLLTGVTSAETSRAVFGKFSTFLVDRLKNVKNFIKEELVGGLQAIIKDVQGLVPIKLPKNHTILPLAEYYQSIFDNSLKASDGLKQIVEATGDALFNFPAYQTVKSWSAGGHAYLYSFEHVGNLSKGSHFLRGVSLAEKSDESIEESKGPAHGDELAYIFEPLDDESNPLNEETSETDARVRENFVNIIAKFAHDLNPLETKKPKFANFMPFSEKNNQFIKIGEEVAVEKDFRYCQMGLWGNMVEKVTGVLCKNILGNLLKVVDLPLPITLPVITNSKDNNKIPILESISSGISEAKDQKTERITRRPLIKIF